MTFRDWFPRGAQEWIPGQGDNEGEEILESTPPPPRRPFRLGKLPLLAGAALVLFSGLPWLARWVTDLWWFRSLGQETVFWTRILPQWGLFAAALVASSAFTFLNWRLAVSRGFADLPGPHPAGRWILGASLVLGVLNGLGTRGAWGLVLRFLHAQPFGTADPVFHRDLGFYVFSLPFWRFAQGWFSGLLLTTLAGCLLVYFLGRSVQLLEGRPWVSPAVRGHLAVLGASLLLLWGAGWWLDRYDLLLSPGGIVFGAGYVDLHVKLPALYLNVGAAAAAAVLLAVNLFRPLWRPSLVALAVLLGAGWIAGVVVPGIVQQYVVKPNEYEMEKPYLRFHMDATLKAYGLDRIRALSVTPSGETTPEDLRADLDTVRNIRLWDYGPLLRTYKQLQEIRSYYDFSDVDIDRYNFDESGVHRQVMLSVRELDSSQLQNPTWVNRHLEFTHGFGVVMNPVNEVAPGGMPVLFVKDLPPKASVSLDIRRPQVYFGEKTNTYALVRTEVKEFDYPMGDANARSTYEGTGGVPLGSLWRRLLFALRFRDTEILFTGSLRPDSRVLFRRSLGEVLQEMAPFLAYDDDPYPVVLGGRILWVQDAYTATDRIPYSKPLAIADPSLEGLNGVNYLRNSVKITLDAYDGTVRFYLMDPADPLAATWARVFPGLFRPVSEMPEGLRAHLRYPEGLFEVQSELYRVYHMTDTNTYYNKEDVWEVSPAGREKRLSPNYVTMKLLGKEKPEFALIVPFMPVGRSNLIGWMAGRCDPEHYGELVVYQFPKQKLIFGPPQIEALIDQNPEISAQMSLWSQRGSDVIRGDLLVVPIGKSLLYVQPLYLKAERGELPELKRVILSTGGRVVWGETFREALTLLVGEDVLGGGKAAVRRLPAAPAVREAEPRPEGEGGIPSPGTKDLARKAQELFEQAQQASRAGDWAAYGQKLRELEAVLRRLVEAGEGPR